MTKAIHLGFELGTGKPVEIPLAHTFVTGQTQLSGKTTALRAIVERSGRRALAFITKRGETFEGRRIRPYLPREGDQPIHWRMVEVILASSVDQKNLKYERLWIINAAKGARTLEDVQANVHRLHDKTKNERAKDTYTLLNEYLELVLPQMRSLRASDTLDLQPGLNVMDLSAIAGQTQAMVIRAALERINHHEIEILTVLPEAWEFAPLSRSTPVRPEAEAMVRKGAAPKVQNFLLCDSQDIAGVSPVVRQGSSVWLFGVQRELNELKRAIKMMPVGVKRPKADDVATLGLGQFFVCYGTHAIKTYVQPAWMDGEMAARVARGAVTVDQVLRQQASIQKDAATTVRRVRIKETTVTNEEAARLTRENERLILENVELRKRLDALEKGAHGKTERPTEGNLDAARRDGVRPAADRATAAQARTFSAEETFDNETLYQAIKARLIAEAPAILQVLIARPELEIRVQRHTIEAEGESLRGRIGQLIHEGFFDTAQTTSSLMAELSKRGFSTAPPNVARELAELTTMGFFTRDNKWYRAVGERKVRVLEVEPA